MTLGRTTITATLERRRASALHQWIRVVAALLSALVFSSELVASPPGDSRAYKLAPGDKITVTVFGQLELSGDIVIDDAGNIALPFLEPIEVKDLTVLECQRRIHDRLANGILRQPSVSVRISELRPLYISGDVRAPGAYPFRYNSTVQSAVAAAGGFGPPELVQGAADSEFLLADERVRQQNFQKQALLVRRARLEAQRDDAKSFSPPAPPGMTENDIAGLVANEKEIFEAQAAILQNQLDLLRSQKPRIQEEIEALNGQTAVVKKQLELVKQHADQYSRLVKQGLGLANAELQFRLTESSQESELWRLTSQVSRLQMDLGELDLKIHEAAAAFKRQVVIELREVRDRLDELDVTLPAAREIRNVKLQYASGLIGVGVKRSISIARVRNGETTVFEATETTPLEPGDIVDVKRLLARPAPYESALAGQPDLQPHQIGAPGAARLVGSGFR
jgi:polysaccharide biosynthesis/export protein